MIPKIIHQTGPYMMFPDHVEDLKKLNPGWEYRFYTDLDCRRFISEHYNSEVWRAYEQINPSYGAARADLFKYLVMEVMGGVYLDIKSTATKPLDEILLPSDKYLLSHWTGKKCRGWGKYPELGPKGEYQQWFIVSEPDHPFLDRAISRVLHNIHSYKPETFGVGKMGTLRTTGPIAYTLAINGAEEFNEHRLVDSEELGFQYSVLSGKQEHVSLFRNHYSTLTTPVVL